MSDSIFDTDRELRNIIIEENRVGELLMRKLEAMKTYSNANSGVLAHRLAEILVLAKNLYTQILPELVKSDESDKESLWEMFTSIRMHLMHMKDCIEDFDTDMLALMEKLEEG